MCIPLNPIRLCPHGVQTLSQSLIKALSALIREELLNFLNGFLACETTRDDLHNGT